VGNNNSSRILLTVLVLPVMAGLAYWAWAGLPWLSLILFVAGVAFLWWLWRPAATGAAKK
jgi:hypothetical protein